jgi:putative endonuclease
MEEKGYIYFMTNRTNNVLYIGVTNSLTRRIVEHAEGRGSVFTSKYNCSKLVYFEVFPTIEQAISREKQLKHFKREWKNQLVETVNPEWRDLSESVISDPDT